MSKRRLPPEPLAPSEAVPETEPAPDPAPSPPEITLPGITLELDVPPAAEAALLRHPALAGREGRSRRRKLELIWLDTADGALAADGCWAEEAAPAPRRLRRLLPDRASPALPGQPDPVAPVESLPGPLLPIAAFAGSERRFGTGGLTVALLTGKLRSVTAEANVARLLLEGPAGQVFATARALAATLPLLPPHASLAEAGRALAQAGDAQPATRPRRAGATDLSGAETIGAALEGALGHLAEVMLHQARLARPGMGPEGVHQLRVATRRARSVLKVFRPMARSPLLGRIETGLKALADALGPARDWDVFLGGTAAELETALDGEAGAARRGITWLRAAATARRDAGYAALVAVLEGAAFRLLMVDLAAAAAGLWRDGAEIADGEAPVRDFAAGLLGKRWRRVVEDGAAIAELPEAELHELRLKGKRLRYAAELFAPLWPGKSARRFLRRLADLQEALGIANDTAVARGLARSLTGGREADRGWACGLVEGWTLAGGRRARRLAVRAFDGFAKRSFFWED